METRAHRPGFSAFEGLRRADQAVPPGNFHERRAFYHARFNGRSNWRTPNTGCPKAQFGHAARLSDAPTSMKQKT
jgi:hypothetical protein